MKINLKDFTEENIRYDWKTIYCGVEEDNYFENKVLAEYATELMAKGDNSEFLLKIAIEKDFSDEEAVQILFQIKNEKFPSLNKNEIDFEKRKLGYVYLSKVDKLALSEEDYWKRIDWFNEEYDYPNSKIINEMLWTYKKSESVSEALKKYLRQEKGFLEKMSYKDNQKIKDIYGIDDDFPIADEKYDTWYKELLNKTENEIDELDIYFMLFLKMDPQTESLGIRKTIEFVYEDPFLQDEMLERVMEEPIELLEENKVELKKLADYLETNVDYSNFTPIFERHDREDYRRIVRDFRLLAAKL